MKTYHAWWIIPPGGCFVTNILEIIEEEEPDHPEQAGDDEDHDDQATVQGAVHLNDGCEIVWTEMILWSQG